MYVWTKGSIDLTLVKGEKGLKNIQRYNLRERKYFSIHNDVHFLSCGEHINQLVMKISNDFYLYKKIKNSFYRTHLKCPSKNTHDVLVGLTQNFGTLPNGPGFKLS